MVDCTLRTQCMICNSRAHTTDRCEYNLLNRLAAPVRHIEPRNNQDPEEDRFQRDDRDQRERDDRYTDRRRDDYDRDEKHRDDYRRNRYERDDSPESVFFRVLIVPWFYVSDRCRLLIEQVVLASIRRMCPRVAYHALCAHSAVDRSVARIETRHALRACRNLKSSSFGSARCSIPNDMKSCFWPSLVPDQ